MKKITIALNFILLTGILISCNSNRNASSNQPVADRKTEAVEIVKTSEDENSEDCVSNNRTAVEGESSNNRLEDRYYISNNRYTQQNRTNFQGASGAGTGSSYASNYIGSSKRKAKKEVCTVDSTKVETLEVDQIENNYYTNNKKNKDELKPQVVNMGWPDTDTTNADSWTESDQKNWEESDNSDWSAYFDSTDSSETSNDWESENIEEQDQQDNNYEELPW